MSSACRSRLLGGKFATTGMWNKVGITWDSSRRGANAGLLSSDAVFTEAERTKMQGWMNDVYGVFKGHVVAARGAKLKKPIDELAAGRVFTGQQALELGLIDKIGTMDDAIHNVAEQAKLKDYEVRVYPEPKNFVEVLFEELLDGDRDPNHLSVAASSMMSLRAPSILDVALPYLKGLDPERLETVKAVIRQLDMLQQERAVLMMPEISIRDSSR